MEAIIRTLDAIGSSFPERVKRRMIELNYHRNKFILRTIFPYLRQGGINNILDIGIGPGVVSLVLRQFGFEVIGVDTWTEYLPNYDNVSGTREDILGRLKEAGIEPLFCDIEKEGLPFQDKSFDMVLLLDVIEHLHYPPKKVLEEIRRVLKAGALLIISTPNASNLKNRIVFMLGKSINPTFYGFKAWFLNDSKYLSHRREYSSHEIRFMCECLDFHVEHIEFSNCAQIPTPIKGTDYYARHFKLNSVNQFIKAIYLVITKLYKTLRYTMISVAKKRE